MRAWWGFAALLAAWFVVGVGHASADECMKLDAWVTWSDGGQTYVTPWPDDACVVPTPGMSELIEPHGHHSETWVPPDPSVPNGAGFDGTVTSP